MNLDEILLKSDGYKNVLIGINKFVDLLEEFCDNKEVAKSKLNLITDKEVMSTGLFGTLNNGVKVWCTQYIDINSIYFVLFDIHDKEDINKMMRDFKKSNSLD